MDLFKSNQYHKIIAHYLDLNKKVATRSQLAQAIGCSPSWITRVLAEEVQLTPDQAMAVCTYFHLSEAETDYFLILVEYERAATPVLKKRLQNKLDAIRKNSRHFDAVVKTDSKMSEKDHAKYYSSWLFAAIHVGCMVRPFLISELSKTFRISETITAGILHELKEMHLVQNQGGRWAATSRSIHLPPGSPLANVAHANWRNHAIQSLQDKQTDGLHYSAIHCLSKKDVETVRKKLKDAILSCRSTIERSPTETLSVLCLDWYEVAPE